jgi:hypothetical protein
MTQIQMIWMIQWRLQRATLHLLVLRPCAAPLAALWRALRLALLPARLLYCLLLLLLLLIVWQQQQQQQRHPLHLLPCSE